jgi:hypothetical protein
MLSEEFPMYRFNNYFAPIANPLEQGWRGAGI